MPVKIASQYKEEIMGKLREGKKPKELATEYPLTLRTIYRYLKEVQDEKAGEHGGKVVEDQGKSSSKVVTTPTQLAVVTTATPGPIVFRMGNQIINLNPEHLYEAFKYCQDIKAMDPAIDDDFSLVLKVAVKHVWEHFCQKEAQRVGVDLEVQKEK